MKRARTRTVLAASLAALVLLAVASMGGATAQEEVTVEAARQVTTDPNPVRLYVSPSMAVHPDQPGTVAILAGDGRSGGCGIHVSRDGGLSWSTPAPNINPEEMPFCSHRNFGAPHGLAFASDGTLYAGTSGSSSQTDPAHPNGPISAYVTRTTDLGRTFTTNPVREHQPFILTNDEGEEFEAFEQWRMSSIAVDPTDPNVVYRGFHRRLSGPTPGEVPFGDRPQRALIAVSRDGGETWTEPLDVLMEGYDGPEEDVFGSSHFALATDPDGTLYGVLRGSPPERGDPRPFYLASTTDQGESWQVEEIYGGAASIGRPTLAVDQRNGNIYVTWDERGAERTDPSDIYFMSSTDGGASWSDPVRLTDDATEGFNKYFPGVTVAPNGRVDVAWYDFRNDPFYDPAEAAAGAMGSGEGERFWDVYYTHSGDGGQTWSAETRITDRSVDGEQGVTFGNQDMRGPVAIAATNSATFLAWPDSRAASGELEAEDVYTTRVRHEAAGGDLIGAPSAGGTELLWSVLGAGVALAVGGLVLMMGTRIARGRPEEKAEPAPVKESS